MKIVQSNEQVNPREMSSLLVDTRHLRVYFPPAESARRIVYIAAYISAFVADANALYRHTDR